MKPQALWRLSLRINPEAEDAVSELLARLFQQPPSVVTDLQSQTTVASVFLPPTTPVSPSSKLALRNGLERIRASGLDPGPGRFSIRYLHARDWAESWKRHFKPIDIGRTLLIKPAWSRRKLKNNQQLLVLNPGLSFGTGQHPTTRFCLEQIVRHRPHAQPKALLDVGTGSGILALAAARLGYRPVEAWDHDPQAVDIAHANAARNRLAGVVLWRRRDLTIVPFSRMPRFDLICANLTADVLLQQQPRLTCRLRPGGILVLAGILHSQFPSVRQAYERAGLSLLASRCQNEWESGAFAATA